jgi:hypothetical protein
MKDSPRRVDKVLASGSSLLRYDGVPDNTKKPKAETDPLSKKEKGWADAKKALVDKQNADPSADVTNEKKAVADAKKALDDDVTKALAKVSDGLWLTVPDFLPDQARPTNKGYTHWRGQIFSTFYAYLHTMHRGIRWISM